MLGCYDFCGYYELSFQWFEDKGGKQLVEEYWSEAISRDSQLHARHLIIGHGFKGMLNYWGHTLAEESPEEGYTMFQRGNHIRGDIQQCPSKGFLIRNGLENYHDYCDHCLGWIGPMMKDAGYAIHHEHNHAGQCWWEFHPIDAEGKALCPPEPPNKEEHPHDVRLLSDWDTGEIDVFRNATRLEQKEPSEGSSA